MLGTSVKCLEYRDETFYSVAKVTDNKQETAINVMNVMIKEIQDIKGALNNMS